MMYLLADTPANRKLILHYIDVWDHPRASRLCRAFRW
ncbi:hypothetical protein J2W46_006840 [Paraburkholderia strydomiana]|nr:hypothetical protein [Paraburkholderia strydomiana]